MEMRGFLPFCSAILLWVCSALHETPEILILPDFLKLFQSLELEPLAEISFFYFYFLHLLPSSPIMLLMNRYALIKH